MSWDPKWEEVFRHKQSWGLYPPEDLIRFMARHYYRVPDRGAVRVLELGCGPGGGPSWFLAREGFSFHGIDGSPTAIERARERFAREGLSGDFRIGDISTLAWEAEYFDCVVDVACLQHNSEAGTATILREVHRVLKPGGRHFSFTAKAGSWGDGKGTPVDGTSYTQVTEGPYWDMGMGLIRFATKESLAGLYGAFTDVSLEYSVRSYDRERHALTHWILECRR